jgi:hypothetical protein
MATILIVTHEYDDFPNRDYLVKGLMKHWPAMGHRVLVARGLAPKVSADIAFLHVDLSVTPDDYVAYASQFPVVINGAVRDIRKRTISRYLAERGDPWKGPVIAKPDLNCGGSPENLHNKIAISKGRPPPHDPQGVRNSYQIYESMEWVPEQVWGDTNVVIERFLPEHDAKGFWLRTWVFFGDRERCNRYCAPKPVVKASDAVIREPVEVPEELRAERKRLGFDYGKFDFVLHNGRVVLLDVNRTPGAPPTVPGKPSATEKDLAQGIDVFVRAANGASV